MIIVVESWRAASAQVEGRTVSAGTALDLVRELVRVRAAGSVRITSKNDSGYLQFSDAASAQRGLALAATDREKGYGVLAGGLAANRYVSMAERGKDFYYAGPRIDLEVSDK
jgi:hypothetical protein